MKRDGNKQFAYVSTFLECLTDNLKSLEELVVSRVSSPKMKRIVALVHLLFFFEDTHFYFDKPRKQKQTTLGLRIRERTPKNNEMTGYIKNWVEWTIKETKLMVPTGIYG